MTIREVIARIEAWHQPFCQEKTRDTIKWGDADQVCTGIAVTVCATVDVIREAARLGANLIITHESIFYGDEFSPADFADNAVFMEKQSLLARTGVVVWRDHDHMHGSARGPERSRPDYIFYGIMKELGWEPYVIGDRLKPVWYRIPETTAGELAQYLLDKFCLTGMRVVGDPGARVSTVFLCGHIASHGIPEKISQAQAADVLIPFEINDWTLSAWVRDAAMLGHGKVIFEMGHFNVEELGMKYMLQWLPEAVGGGLPITFLPSGDSFRYLLHP